MTSATPSTAPHGAAHPGASSSPAPGGAVPPVVRSVVVRLAPAEAFTLFTQEMRSWWPFAGHSCGDEDAVDVRFEPRVGGTVTEIGRHGERWTWGTLTEWDPPHAFAMRWHPGLEAGEATLLRVNFAAAGEGTEVRVHHGGWEARGSQAQARRDQYDGGWPRTLQAFARHAAARRSAA